ncbi:MAG: helix-turn-helix domain-containing protein [bacterium]|nr:helix-turn-helix domain-containing protein [bacterium]
MRKANCEQSAKRSVDTFNASNQAELRKQIELLEQRMSKSPNNMKDGGSHFLYRRERMIRFKMLQKNIPQKMLAKRLNLTESYISKLITGERYNKDFERYIIHILDVNYYCL